MLSDAEMKSFLYGKQGPTPSRNFKLIDSVRTAQTNFWKNKHGDKVSPAMTYCQTSAQINPSMCGDFETKSQARTVGSSSGAGQVQCVDRNAKVMWCCTGSLSALEIPRYADAPCFSSQMDPASLIPGPVALDE